MAIYIGNQKYGINIGSTKIKEAYVGSTKVYDSGDTPLTLLYEYLPEFSTTKTINASFCKSGWSSSSQSLYSKIVLEYKIKNGSSFTTGFRLSDITFGSSSNFNKWSHTTYYSIANYATVRAINKVSTSQPSFTPSSGIITTSASSGSYRYDINRESSEISGGSTAYKAFKLVLHLPTSHTGNSAINLTDCEIWTTDSNGDYYLAGTGSLDLPYSSSIGYGLLEVTLSASSSSYATKQTFKEFRVYGG